MGKATTKSQPTKLFESLVHNAIDFFQKSISEFEEYPKYSVINFYAAIELFLKAKIMQEHWTLIITKPENAVINKFQSGDFQSISLTNAIDRLKNIVNQPLTKDEIECFNNLRKHRNKLVHFFNPAYVKKPDKTTLYTIAVEQCKGWFFIQRLLTEKWAPDFARFSRKFRELSWLMKRHKQFLKVKYDTILPEIKEEQKRGVKFFKCTYCKFMSAREEEEHEPLFERKCRVCDSNFRVLKVECADCKNLIEVHDLGEGVCAKCKAKIDIEYLISQFGEDEHSKDYFTSPSHAYCGECSFAERPTVVPWGEDSWLCLYCLTSHDSVGECEKCGDLVTGDLSESYLMGCAMCNGILEDD